MVNNLTRFFITEIRGLNKNDNGTKYYKPWGKNPKTHPIRRVYDTNGVGIILGELKIDNNQNYNIQSSIDFPPLKEMSVLYKSQEDKNIE